MLPSMNVMGSISGFLDFVACACIKKKNNHMIATQIVWKFGLKQGITNWMVQERYNFGDITALICVSGRSKHNTCHGCMRSDLQTIKKLISLSV